MNERFDHQSFFEDACAVLARNTRELLSLAGLPISSASVLKVVESLPLGRNQLEEGHPWRRHFCSMAMEAAHGRHEGTPEYVRVHKLIDYFAAFAWRLPEHQDMLIAAFRGVLSQKWEEEG